MKPRAFIVVVGLALSTFDADAAVVSVAIGQSVIGGGATLVDFDGDGTPELSFRGNGATCTDDVPTSTCVYAVSITGTAAFEFLLQDDPFDSPAPLVDGDVLGDGSFIGAWGSKPFDTIHVSAVDHLLEPARPSYPGHLDGIDVLSIGFRQSADGGLYRYGWFDVRLRTYLRGSDGVTILGEIPWPTVLTVHYSDTLDEPVSFVTVPEASTPLLVMLGSAIALKRTRRTRRRS